MAVLQGTTIIIFGSFLIIANNKLYIKARELFGQEPANIPTITRPWIVPGEIIVREGETSAYIFKANLKVMLEEDYLKSPQSTVHSPQKYSFKDSRLKELNQYSTQLIRELIIPKLTKEVNTAKRYAALRQVFFSLIMARWFKERFASESTEHREPRTEQINLTRLIDTGDLTNLTSKEPWSKSYYFNEYKKSFANGEYNLKEQVSTPTGQVIRSYVSGGIKIIAGSPAEGGWFNKVAKFILPFILEGGNLFISLTSGAAHNNLRGKPSAILSKQVIAHSGLLFITVSEAADRQAIEGMDKYYGFSEEDKKNIQNYLNGEESLFRVAEKILKYYSNLISKIKRSFLSGPSLSKLSLYEIEYLLITTRIMRDFSNYLFPVQGDFPFHLHQTLSGLHRIRSVFSNYNGQKVNLKREEIINLVTKNYPVFGREGAEEIINLIAKYDLLRLHLLVTELPKKEGKGIIAYFHGIGDVVSGRKNISQMAALFLESHFMDSDIKYIIDSSNFLSFENSYIVIGGYITAYTFGEVTLEEAMERIVQEVKKYKLEMDKKKNLQTEIKLFLAVFPEILYMPAKEPYIYPEYPVGEFIKYLKSEKNKEDRQKFLEKLSKTFFLIIPDKKEMRL